jgi:cardiolipin synthase A/B
MALQPLRTLLKRVPAGSGDFSRHQDQYVPGNRLTLFTRGDELYDAMLSAIESAEETVHLETYILRHDKSGQRFAEKLSAKARAGVRVRVIFDSVGALDIDPGFIHKMRNSGVQFLEYHPIAPWRPRWTWLRRDHRKILVVDGKTAFTGGANISHDHAPKEDGGRAWYDCHARVEGPAAHELDRAFRAVWFKETGRWFPIDLRKLPELGPSKVWVATNHEFIHRYKIRSAYLTAIKAAQKRVTVANAYFVPDIRTSRALALAARRGVDVRLIVQGASDVPEVWAAGRFQYDYLLSRGVRIFEWQGPIMHAKAAVVDGQWCTIGSYNLDHRSLLSNLEVNLHVVDADFSARLSRRLDEDAASSTELKLETWRRRPFMEKAREVFWYQFRHLF